MACSPPAVEPDCRAVYAALVEQHQDAVFRYALRLTRHLQDAEDLLQETLLRGYRRFGQLDRTESARPWLLRIATNAFIGIYRRRVRRDEHIWSYDDVAARADAAVAVVWPEAPSPIAVHGEVLAAVAALPVAYREAVTLVDLGDADYSDAAEALSVPIGTVMSRLHRGRALLRERLAGYAADLGLAA